MGGCNSRLALVTFCTLTPGLDSFHIPEGKHPMLNLQGYLTIKEAAAYLGVTPNTLRNWGATGKITEYRHPINSYRLYKPADLQGLLAEVEKSADRKSGFHKSADQKSGDNAAHGSNRRRAK